MAPAVRPRAIQIFLPLGCLLFDPVANHAGPAGEAELFYCRRAGTDARGEYTAEGFVVLKRTNDGGHMELQAIRYVAMVPAMTFDQLIDVHARFRSSASPDAEGARAAILDFLGWAPPDEERFGENVRIILASADFGKELTTAVVWPRRADVLSAYLKCFF